MKSLDYTYSDTWERRKIKLKGVSYEDFLNSNHWKKTKENAFQKGDKYKICKFCNTDKNIHLHHTTYKFINTKKELEAIIPLCSKHHFEVHVYAKLNNISIRIATDELTEKYSGNVKRDITIHKTNFNDSMFYFDCEQNILFMNNFILPRKTLKMLIESATKTLERYDSLNIPDSYIDEFK